MSTIAYNRMTVNSSDLPLVEATGEILEDINPASGKRTDWSGKKKMSLKLAEVLATARQIDETIISESRLAAVADCASFLLFARDAAQNMKLRNANFCHHRLCPMCNWRRSLLLFAQVSQMVARIREIHEKDGVRFLFVTFTIRNVTNSAALAAALDNLNAAFRKLTAKGKGGAKAAAAFRENLLGYMKAIEITYKGKGFHPHIHALFEMRPSYFAGRGYIKKREWQELWTELLGVDYDALVMPKAITNEKERGAVAEVAKYPTKATDIIAIKDAAEAARICIELMKATRGRRFITFGGEMKEVRHELRLADVEAADADLTNADQQSDIDAVENVLFRWNAKFGVYLC